MRPTGGGGASRCGHWELKMASCGYVFCLNYKGLELEKMNRAVVIFGISSACMDSLIVDDAIQPHVIRNRRAASSTGNGDPDMLQTAI